MINKIVFLVLSLTLIGLVSGECQENNVKCLSANTFVFCENNGETEFKCPYGDVCTTHKDICRPNCGDDPSNPVIPSKCGVCESSVNKLFACVSESAFIFCYGKDRPYEGSEGQCKEGFVCDVNNPQVCSPEGTVEPSCVTDFTGLPTIPTTGTTQCPGTYTPPATTTPPTTTIETTTQKEPSADLQEICDSNPGKDRVYLRGCRIYVQCRDEDKPEDLPYEGNCLPEFANLKTGACQQTVDEACKGEYDHLCENATDISYIYIEGTNCKEYVSCNKAGDGYIAMQTQCTRNYFDKEERRCVDEKPENC